MGLELYEDDQPALLQWAAVHTTTEAWNWPEGAHAIAVIDGESRAILAVMVTVETYQGIIDAHISSDKSAKWATKRIIEWLFGYLFFVRGAFRVQGIVSDKAPNAFKLMMLRLGFKIEATLENGVNDGCDSIMFGMTRRNCPWIKEKE